MSIEVGSNAEKSEKALLDLKSYFRHQIADLKISTEVIIDNKINQSMANTLEVVSKIKPLESKVDNMEADVKEYADYRTDQLDEKFAKHFLSCNN